MLGFELEGIFNLQECCFHFLNRSLPLLPKEKVFLKPGERKIVKVEAPFSDEISSLAIIKLLNKLTQCHSFEGEVYLKHSYVGYA